MWHNKPMKYYSWDSEKNRRLKAERKVCIEEAVFCIERGLLLDIVEPPYQERYAGQRIFIVKIRGYACLVPFVETERDVFLKTIIPSHKATRDYLKGDGDGEG